MFVFKKLSVLFLCIFMFGQIFCMETKQKVCRFSYLDIPGLEEGLNRLGQSNSPEFQRMHKNKRKLKKACPDVINLEINQETIKVLQNITALPDNKRNRIINADVCEITFLFFKNTKIGDLKEQIFTITGIPKKNQKIFKFFPRAYQYNPLFSECKETEFIGKSGLRLSLVD